MEEVDNLLADMKSKMTNSLQVFKNEMQGLRTGRASTAFLDPVVVTAYGSKMPLNQLATVSTPNSSSISVQVWDQANTKAVEKAIVEANLGVMPSANGSNIHINIPPLSEDRRKSMVKLAHKYGENAKISIRNIRRDHIEKMKKNMKEWSLSEDDIYKHTSQIQKVTDQYTDDIDSIVSSKEKEIMTI